MKNKRYEKKFNENQNLEEDATASWGKIKKEALSFMQQFSKCDIDYKEYAKSNFNVKKVNYSFRSIFTANLKEGKFNFIPNDSMSATLYTDEAKGLKFWGNGWELYIIVY